MATSQSPTAPPSAHALGLRAFTEALRRETDRACAVLAGSFLDSALEELFHARMITRAPGALFDGNGPASGFAAKIDLAYALGWISPSEHEDLHTVRRIRNAFAHPSRGETSFGARAIHDQCMLLQHTNVFLHEARAAAGTVPDEVLARIEQHPRARFELAVGFLRQALTYRTSHAQHAATPLSLLAVRA